MNRLDYDSRINLTKISGTAEDVTKAFEQTSAMT